MGRAVRDVPIGTDVRGWIAWSVLYMTVRVHKY